MTRGNKVRARKRQQAAGVAYRDAYTPRSNRPNRNPDFNNFEPGRKPEPVETFERPVLRRMLRDKARHDIQTQYGRQGNCSNTVVYLGFDKRGRRRAEKIIARRWFDQIREQMQKGGETTRHRGVIRGLLQTLLAPFKGRENTLATSGFGR